MKSIFDQWYDDNYQKKLKHHDSYWKCKQSWLAAQKQQLDETNALRAKVAELQSSHDALEAKLEKYENLDPVAWQIRNGVCHAGIRSNKEDAESAARNMQKCADLGGSLCYYHVRPLYALERAEIGKEMK